MGNIFQTPKTVVVLRGLPGSGKTTYANNLARRNNGKVYSSEDYFVRDGVYTFDASHLKDSHLWNQERAREAMGNDVRLIIIDNTNVRKWEAKPYVKSAIECGYRVKFKEPPTWWRHNVDELVKRSVRNVPRNVIERMNNEWETDFTVPNVLNSKAPWEK